MTKKLKLTLSNTIFKESPVVFVSANPEDHNPRNINELIEIMSKFAFLPVRNSDDSFLFAVDHCFGIKGQGTVLTGTILQGSVGMNDVSEIK